MFINYDRFVDDLIAEIYERIQLCEDTHDYTKCIDCILLDAFPEGISSDTLKEIREYCILKLKILRRNSNEFF